MTTPSESVAIEVVGDLIVDRHFYHSDDGVVEVGELGRAAGLAPVLGCFAQVRVVAGARLDLDRNMA